MYVFFFKIQKHDFLHTFARTLVCGLVVIGGCDAQ